MEILRKIIFVCIIVLPFLGTSQITFYKKYTSGSFDQGNGLTQLPDSSYAITGTSGGFDNNSGQAFLMITDSLGNQKWTKNYGGFGDDIGVRVIHVPGDGFFIAGYSGSTSNGNFDFVLYKTDESGNLQWEKKYGGLDWEKLNDAALLSDGGLILVGETEGLNSLGKDIYMVRTNSLGDTIWTKTIRTPVDDFVNAVEVLSSTEFVIGGNLEEAGLSKGILSAYNIDGTEVWTEFLNQAGISTVNDITIHQNEIFAVGFLKNPSENKDDLWLTKTDLTGGFIGHYYEQFYELNTFFNTVIVKDPSIFYMGMMTESPEVTPYPGGLDALVHRYNSANLFFLSSVGFSGYNKDMINQMIVANDGGIVLVGTVSDDSDDFSLGTDVMLVRIGPNDEVPPNADTGNDLVNLMTEQKKAIAIFPNPTRSFINIPDELKNKHFKLLNIQGQVVKSGTVTSKIYLDTLEEGIYFISVNDQKQIWTAKIIKK